MPQAGGDEHYYKRRRLSANGAALVMLIFRRPHRIVSERLRYIIIFRSRLAGIIQLYVQFLP